MPKIIKREFQIRDYWISQRKDGPVYYANIYNETTKSVRRFSLRTEELSVAKEKLLTLSDNSEYVSRSGLLIILVPQPVKNSNHDCLTSALIRQI